MIKKKIPITKTSVKITAVRAFSALLLAVFACSLIAAPVQALTAEQRKLYDDTVFYFNFKDDVLPECAPGGTAIGGLGTPNSSIEGDNPRIAYEFFVSKGLAPFRSAGIVGNLQVEAPGLDPRINQGKGGAGRGIGQWSVGGRWDSDPVNVLKFAREQGKSEYDLVLQLEFIWFEMNNVAPWKNALPAVQGATTIEQATQAFMEQYERPGVPHFDRRVGAARAILQLYGGGAAASGPAAAGGTAKATGGGGGATGLAGGTCGPGAAGGSFTGAPGQTKPLGKGFTLNENTDYSSIPCPPGTAEYLVYRHPVRGFQIRLCKINGTSIIVASIVADRVAAMVTAAAAAGVTLNGGGFRTYEQQFAARRANGCSQPAGPSNAGCSPPTAVPGNSQHERGLAIDFAVGGTIRRGSPQFNWLSANAAQYGYFNLPSESWHWSPSGN